MNLYYLTYDRFSQEAARTYQILKTCEALSNAGVHITLVAGDHAGRLSETRLHHYMKENRIQNFRLRLLKTLSEGWPYVIRRCLFAFQAMKLVRSENAQSAVVFSRERTMALMRLLCAFSNIKCIYEWHRPRENWRGRLLDRLTLRLPHGLVVISGLLKAAAVEAGVRAGAVCVAHDGVALDLFASDLSKEEARRRCGLDPGKPLVVYSGTVNYMISGVDVKGVDIAVEAMEHLPDCQLVVLGLVKQGAGGTPLASNGNIRYLGRLERQMVPAHLRAADVLILPNRAVGSFSPLKLFEYMASGRPIVASDVPQLREVLVDGENALLFEAGRPEALARAVRRVLGSPGLAERLAARARQDVERYTWRRRGETIRDFIRGLAGGGR